MSDPLDALWLLCEEELNTAQRMSAAVDKAKKGGTDLGGGQVKGAGRAGLEIGRKPQQKPDLSGGAKQADSGDYLVAGKPGDDLGKVDTSDPQALTKRSIDTARQSGVPFPVAVKQATGQEPAIDTPQAKATVATGMSAASASNDKPGRDGLIQGRVDVPGAVSVSARIHDLEGEQEVSQQNLQEPGRSETDPDLQEPGKNKASGSQPPGDDEPSTAGQAVAQKSSDPNKTLETLTPEQELDDDIGSIKTTIGTGEDTPDSIEYKSQQTQPEISPRQLAREEERKQTIIDSLTRMMETPEKKKGAGANKLSREDAELLKKYVQGEGPKIERMEISDDDMAFAKDYLKKNFKQAFTKLKLGAKGAPKELYEGRGDQVLKSYLANKGLSAVTGDPLAYSASELDHVTSLGNGGVDGFDNWAWVDKRYNQFMSSLDDEGVLKKVDTLLSMNPDDERLKELKSELSNETRNRYTTYFRNKGYNNVTIEDIKTAKGEAGNQMLKALASVAGVNTYKGSDDRTRARGRFIGYPALKAALIDKIKPITEDQQEEFDEALMEIKKFIEEKNMEMEPFTKRGRKKRKSVQEAYLEWILETKFGYTFIQEEVEEEYEEEELDVEDDTDYNDDVDFLRKYGRA